MNQNWSSLLRQRSELRKPWLIVPTSPRESDDYRGVSFAELHQRADEVAGAMLYRANGEATRTVLIANNSAECAICVLAALSAGLVLVPVAPPTSGPASASWRASLQSIVNACQPVLVVGSEVDLQGVTPAPGMFLASFEELFAAEGRRRQPCERREGELVALWQHTSGTTNQAKAVVLTHANLFSNIRSIGQRVDASSRDVGACWLPLFHDMGLIGSLLFSVYWGMSLVLMKPRSFIAHPEAWLWAIDRFKVTCSAAPNSAYEICARRIAERKTRDLDLSSWRVAFNGAEQVHAGTLERFCKRYETHNFRREAMYPVYGLAEHTVAATLPTTLHGPDVEWVDAAQLAVAGLATTRGEQAEGARAMVSVGSALPGHAIRIVGDDSCVLPDRQVGEIELNGPSRMLGYRGDDRGEVVPGDGWLRTGDLGYLVGGSLFVVGRRKHVVKRGGARIDAAAVEGSVRTLPGVAARAVAVFGVDDCGSGSERLVVQVEAPRLSDAEKILLRREIISAVLEVAGGAPDVIEFVPPGFIPRTTSGKVQHGAARERFLGERP